MNQGLIRDHLGGECMIMRAAGVSATSPLIISNSFDGMDDIYRVSGEEIVGSPLPTQ